MKLLPTPVSFKSILIIGSILVFTGMSAHVVSIPAIDWRAKVVVLKIQGEFSDLGWWQLLRMLRPGSGYYLEPVVLTKNLYRTIVNPYSSDSDIAAGAKIFRAQCSLCHGSEGTGGTGPNLTPKQFSHGDSDWALFQIISAGIPGTAMEGRTLPEVSTWQVIAYIRSLTRTPPPSDYSNMLAHEDFADKSTPDRVTYEHLLRASEEPDNWLSYSGCYASHRHSGPTQINRDNVHKMKLRWAFQMPTIESVVESTPLVIDGVMYLTEPPNNVLALDAYTGRQRWRYERRLPEKMPLGDGRINRGVAVLADKVYLGTLDAHLIALDSKTGTLIWDVKVAESSSGYSITGAPLIVKDKVIVGVAGGEYGIRGFLDAYDASLGQRVWRFYTIPEPGEPGNTTWAGDSWKTGGAQTWLTGSFDPDLNLIYWGVGNPAPDFQGDVRKGDNLFSNSVVALDADTGDMKWYFQFTPHDEHDWDSNQIPVLIDSWFQGSRRQLMLWANRNAFYYVLDRATGEFLLARAFAKQTWAEHINSKGRPVIQPGSSPSPKGTLTYPGTGATNWWSPSYSPLAHLFYVPVMENGRIFFKDSAYYTEGEPFIGGSTSFEPGNPRQASVRALVPETGELKWEFRPPPGSGWGAGGGILSTRGNLVFWGSDENFFALDADSGQELWRVNAGGRINAAPITYLSKREQQVTIAAGRTIFTFGIDQ